ncbi:MAG: HAMP domain-containing histidine kinase [Acidimicrobiia bacterium]|nr:HAMP domain-containing histidine kinase [Acidimicrobiia bacterium]NNL27190.1 HAMP domain-containing histidine kinase [Acidimicrobiia bacterium]
MVHITRRAAVSQSAMIGGAIAAVVALAVGALLLANTFMAQQVADDALRLDKAQEALAANELTVAALSQALLLTEDLFLGVADEATAQKALDEAHRRVAGLQRSSDELLAIEGLDDSMLSGILASTIDVASSVVSQLDEGDAGTASRTLTSGLVHFENLRDQVSAIRDESRASIDASGGIAGQSGSTVAFLVALLIPALAIVGYRWIAQNQVQVAEVELDARLEAEQEITRSKDEFIANVSHELRTPLTSIFGLSELLLEEGLVDPESSIDLLALINKEATELTRMVEDILVLARAEGGSLTYQVEQGNVLAEVEDYLNSLVDRSGITVEFEEMEAWLDRARFRHIIRNLISNAQVHGGPEIRILGSAERDDISVTVADNGNGIADAERGRLFSAYFHQGEDPLTRGTLGMGLAAVKALARGMNGDVRYERVGGWTKFIVSLPIRMPDGSSMPTDLSQVA